jgi:hypothetical protein
LRSSCKLSVVPSMGRVMSFEGRTLVIDFSGIVTEICVRPPTDHPLPARTPGIVSGRALRDVLSEGGGWR